MSFDLIQFFRFSTPTGTDGNIHGLPVFRWYCHDNVNNTFQQSFLIAAISKHSSKKFFTPFTRREKWHRIKFHYK